jgi:hypothetical protein
MISVSVIMMVAFFTALMTSFALLSLSQLGLIAFTGGGWLVSSYHLIARYLGHSMLFFIPTFLGYCFFFVQLRWALERYSGDALEMENIRFYNKGMSLFTTLFFAIGVLFTAWGMQNALSSALGNVSRSEAGQIGAWGILRRMVDNGILVALWSTIVGGAGGYLMRLVKYLALGRKLNHVLSQGQDDEKAVFFSTLEAIRSRVDDIERKLPAAGPTPPRTDAPGTSQSDRACRAGDTAASG